MSGEAGREVPNLIGMTLEEAQAKCRALGLEAVEWVPPPVQWYRRLWRWLFVSALLVGLLATCALAHDVDPDAKITGWDCQVTDGDLTMHFRASTYYNKPYCDKGMADYARSILVKLKPRAKEIRGGALNCTSQYLSDELVCEPIKPSVK